MPKKDIDYDDSELLYLVSESNEDADDIIYEKYAPVIEYYSKKFLPSAKGTGLEYNDLRQEGLVGLASAIKNYSMHKDIKFSTFAFTCIKRKISTAIKNANRKKHSILNESFSLDYQNDEGKDIFENFIASTDESVEDLLVSKESEDYFRNRVNDLLTDFEKMVYELKLNGFSYDEIAKILGKTYKSVESAIFRIRIKLKKIISEIIWLLIYFVLLFNYKTQKSVFYFRYFC